MRGIRRLVVCTAAAGLLAAGAVGASMGAAHADTPLTGCLGAADSSTPYDCSMTGTISNPETITVGVTATSGADNVTVNWAVACPNGNGTAGAPAASQTPVSLSLTLPTSTSGTCTVNATVELSPVYSTTTYKDCVSSTASPTPTPTSTATVLTCPQEFSASISYTSASSGSTTTTSAVHPVKGYDGKCLDDKGNSSANGAEVVIWSCSGTDQAENWKFSNNEFVHNNKCLNDKANGGSGSKVILYSCNGGSNEKWSELANGELKLQSHGGSLCLNDPRSSTKNGTQLIVYTCKVSANEKWKLP